MEISLWIIATVLLLMWLRVKPKTAWRLLRTVFIWIGFCLVGVLGLSAIYVAFRYFWKLFVHSIVWWNDIGFSGGSAILLTIIAILIMKSMHQFFLKNIKNKLTGKFILFGLLAIIAGWCLWMLFPLVRTALSYAALILIGYILYQNHKLVKSAPKNSDGG